MPKNNESKFLLPRYIEMLIRDVTEGAVDLEAGILECGSSGASCGTWSLQPHLPKPWVSYLCESKNAAQSCQGWAGGSLRAAGALPILKLGCWAVPSHLGGLGLGTC